MARVRAGWLIAGVAAAWLGARACGDCTGPRPDALRIATFNIEDFPKDDRQVAGAFTEIAATRASIVAVQEIGDAGLLRAAAHARLGRAWQFVHEDASPGAAWQRHDLGVLFDGARWTLRSTRVHDETRLGGRHKPVFEVRLAPAGGGPIVRVLVVHLKSGSEGREVRARQYAALARVARDATASGERVIVLGDFNATEPADRGDLARLAAATGLTWASAPLACSAFWARDDGCPRSRLDHVLTWAPPARIEALGACATEGCEWQASCPVYARQVSDHCPVVVTFSPR